MSKQIITLLFFLILLSGLFFECIAAENGWRHWKSGEVTSEVYQEGHFNRIGIDNIPYTFMPDARIWRVSRQNHGGFVETPIKLQNIYQYQKIEMLVQGFRIYQLKVTP